MEESISKFRKWIKENYGYQDAYNFENTQAEDIAIDYAEHCKSQWISVKDRLPELNEPDKYGSQESDYLEGYMSCGEIYRVRYFNPIEEDIAPYFYYTDDGELCDKITHWRHYEKPKDL